MYFDSHRRNAFTLIELLVVIAIIAILAGLLLPTLARAKEKSRQTACINGLHQQTLAVLIYADEQGGFLPPTAYNDKLGNEVDWPSILDPYLNYVAKIHICPTDRNSKVNSYGLNELTFVDMTDPGVTTQTKLVTVTYPAACIMQGDLGTEDDFVTPRPDTLKLTAPGSTLNDDADARPSSRHFDTTDLGFMDGHGEHLALRVFYTNQVPVNKWFIP